ncbi:hypothetical protein F4604DRAFT_1787964 [Suillus subluteus]|nr:hypothetical protein F4604DRAFT_1787964 [Suillus subluteus]
MKGFLSLVLVSIALLQMTAAAPTVSERSQAIKKREGEQSMSQLVCSTCTRLTRMSMTQMSRSASGFGLSVCFNSSVFLCTDEVADNDDDEGNYLVLVLFLSDLLTHSVKYAVLDNPEGTS